MATAHAGAASSISSTVASVHSFLFTFTAFMLSPVLFHPHTYLIFWVDKVVPKKIVGGRFTTNQ
jgi:hypothetical protein